MGPAYPFSVAILGRTLANFSLQTISSRRAATVAALNCAERVKPLRNIFSSSKTREACVELSSLTGYSTRGVVSSSTFSAPLRSHPSAECVMTAAARTCGCRIDWTPAVQQRSCTCAREGGRIRNGGSSLALGRNARGRRYRRHSECAHGVVRSLPRFTAGMMVAAASACKIESDRSRRRAETTTQAR